MKARVLANFQAQKGTFELTLYADEVLTIDDTNVGSGWWKGTNERGETGLFPAGFVEPIEEHQTSSSQAQISQPPPQEAINQQNSSGAFFSPEQVQVFKQSDQAPHWDPWSDSEFGSDDEYPEPATLPVGTPNYPQPASTATTVSASRFTQDLDKPENMIKRLSVEDTRNLPPVPIKSKNNFNRFSNFVKSGLAAYLLEDKGINVSLENITHIQYDQELGIIWKPNLNSYKCSITIHGKESKMKGFKTYISYDVTPSTSNVVVRRRYKHFDWLMQRLEEKFLVIPLPPLPEKQIAGRFQDDFVEHRKNLLQLWVNYITRHPVLSQCDVWWHFITSRTDTKSGEKGWKDGKRKAEKDELVGANFFFSVQCDSNKTPLDRIKSTKQLDNFQTFVAKFDDAVKHMYSTTVDQSKKFSSVYAKDYKKLSESIKGLASAFLSGTAWRTSLGLNEAIRQTSTAYEEISRLHEEEPKFDFEPMADMLHQYRGLLSGWPEILQLHKNTMNTRAEQERLLEESKISEAVMARVNSRANIVTYSTLAEINHFHNERLIDFKQMMQSFLVAQINFHSEILGKLQTALNKVNDA